MKTTNTKRRSIVGQYGFTKSQLSNNSGLVKQMMMQRTRCLGMC